MPIPKEWHTKKRHYDQMLLPKTLGQVFIVYVGISEKFIEFSILNFILDISGYLVSVTHLLHRHDIP